MAKSITVVAVTSLAPKSHGEAIERTAACIPHPCEKILISPTWHDSIDKSIRWKTIAAWMPGGKWSLQDMGRFLLHGLYAHIDTDVAILVQWDGYAINPTRWDDGFLDYDFIGAPWPRRFDFVKRSGARVGNGGFSLRSKRWLEACSELPPSKLNEDFYAAGMNRQHFEKRGCRIAPLDLAMRWSMEHRIEEYPRWGIKDSLGFHGLTDRDPMRKKLRLDPNS